MLTIANSLLRDSVYGMIYRVCVGAALSTIDAAIDIYVISTYYRRSSDRLTPYMFYKIARDDFYWFVHLVGSMGVCISFLEKVGVKIIIDYCGCVYFRHPFEVSL